MVRDEPLAFLHGVTITVLISSGWARDPITVFGGGMVLIALVVIVSSWWGDSDE